MTSMTVFIMHCCTNKRSWLRAGGCLRQDRPKGERLMKHLANRLGWQKTPTKSLVMVAVQIPSSLRLGTDLPALCAPLRGLAARTLPLYPLQVLLIALALLCLCIPTASAEGIEVRKAEAHFSDSSYQLSANFDIRLNFVVEQALEQGVPLYFNSEFSLTYPRWYWLDEVITQNEQTIKLSYNTLTRQYRITRGALFQNFASLDDALRIIGRQSAVPIPAELLKGSGSYISELLFKKDSNYIAAVRLRLDVTQLPKPLQVNALASDDWSLDSGWYRWIVRPDAAAH